MADIRVLIADDDPRLRDTLRLLIDSEPGMAVCGVADDGADAVARAAATEPDVVLMDVRMPVMNGLDAARRLLGENSAARVIVLTMFDLDAYVYEALRAGASGFLLKNAPPAELVRAVRVVHRGDALLAPETTKRLIGRLAPSPRLSDPRIAALYTPPGSAGVLDPLLGGGVHLAWAVVLLTAAGIAFTRRDA